MCQSRFAFGRRHADLVFAYVLTIVSLACAGKNPCPFSANELRRTYQTDSFWRELVLPADGPYRLYDRVDALRGWFLVEPEAHILKCIDNQTNGQNFILVHAVSEKDAQPKALLRVRALCIHLNDHPSGSTHIDAVYHNSFRELDLLEQLTGLSQLVHLELYDWLIEGQVERFSKIQHLKQLDYLGLPHDTRDEDLVFVRSLKSLRFLNASGTQVHGPGLQVVADLPALRILDLRALTLRPGELSWLGKARELRTLLLAGSSVTDDDIRSLEGVSSLRRLALHSTRVTDGALKTLFNLSELEWVSLYDTHVTSAGIAQLRKARPELLIETTPPMTELEFAELRLRCLACFGDRRAQWSLAKGYETGGLFAEVPVDATESLTWYLMLCANPDWDRLVGSPPLTRPDLEEKIETLKAGMTSLQISDAYHRVRFLRLIASYGSGAEITRHGPDDRPVYQYAFP